MRGGGWWFIILASTLAATSAVASDLSAAADDFVDAHDRLIKSRGEVAAGRAALAANINDQERLEDAVKEWFNDRADVERFAGEKVEARADLRDALNYKGVKIVKPVKPTGTVQQIAQSFMTHYDRWVALGTTLDTNIEQMRTALQINNDTALRDAATSFFDNRRTRHNERLQWQADLRALKKALKFKGTAKAAKPPGDSLKEHTQEFLNDRSEWEALGTKIQADLNNVRATLNTPDSLNAALLTLLTDRNLRAAKAKEMAADRKAMRARNALKSLGSTIKSLFNDAKPNSDDADEEEGELEQSPDHL